MRSGGKPALKRRSCWLTTKLPCPLAYEDRVIASDIWPAQTQAFFARTHGHVWSVRQFFIKSGELLIVLGSSCYGETTCLMMLDGIHTIEAYGHRVHLYG
jgi:hypothetical protein